VPTLRRLSLITLGIAFVHVVFGAIVRISGSGMGCGDHWPTCDGAWVPQLTQPTLIIELTHRVLVTVLTLAVIGLAATALARRTEAGVGGPGGVLRSASLAVGLVVVTALFGAVTVKAGNAPWATVGHWSLAASTLAVLAATAIRAGGLGAPERWTPQPGRVARGAVAAAGLAFAVVIMGGLTAKIPGANAACPSFPLCGAGLESSAALRRVQMTHRILAYLLLFHVVGLTIGLTKRQAAAAILRPLRIALAATVLQVAIAAAMVLLQLPPVLRSLHQAVGVAIWLSLFSTAYLAVRLTRSAAGADEAGVVAARPLAHGEAR